MKKPAANHSLTNQTQRRKPPMASEMKFLTIEDVAKMLQVTRTTIYNLKEKGLPYIKLGKNIRFDEEEVVKWVKSNQRQTIKNPEK